MVFYYFEREVYVLIYVSRQTVHNNFRLFVIHLSTSIKFIISPNKQTTFVFYGSLGLKEHLLHFN